MDNDEVTQEEMELGVSLITLKMECLRIAQSTAKITDNHLDILHYAKDFYDWILSPDPEDD